MTKCQQPLPADVLLHNHLPSRHLCQECVTAYLLPHPVFARQAPAARRSSDTPESAPGGQPVPDPPATNLPLPGAPAPQWARCPMDQHLHLLPPDEAQAAGIEGHGRAGCGRLIPRAGLTIDGASVVGWCWSCLTVGTATRDVS
ncbi:MAG: hypothetical protein M3460_29915 [Actinomycetota bacterium]|nr:hypothetical protein [Actinomycetota bacterium]